MTPNQRLAEVFDRGLRRGVDSLSADERDLYLIQDFIIEQEINGLSGYFYNRVAIPGHIPATVNAMRQHGLLELGAILNDALQLFEGYGASNPAKKMVRCSAGARPRKPFAHARKEDRCS
jgi:hypothetical protein